MFANHYLIKNKVPALIPDEPDSKTGIAVVIPCLREPAVLQTLNALLQCKLPACDVEVIFSSTTRKLHRKTLKGKPGNAQSG